ncbi:MAG: YqhA family protein, partial [Betaproteobacteria bacterium]
MQLLPRFIFMSRWLQVPLYLGLIVAQLVYVWQFWVELIHLVEAMMGSENALEIIRQSVAVPGADPSFAKSMS